MLTIKVNDIPILGSLFVTNAPQKSKMLIIEESMGRDTWYSCVTELCTFWSIFL